MQQVPAVAGLAGRYQGDPNETPLITQTNAVAFSQNLGGHIRCVQGRFDALCQGMEAGYAGVSESDGMAETEPVIAADLDANVLRPGIASPGSR